MGLYKMGKLASELGQFTHFVESHQLSLIGLPLDFAPSETQRLKLADY